MPLLFVATNSSGDIYWTHDGTADGEPAHVEWKGRGEERNLRREAAVSLSGVVATTEFQQRRSLVFFFPWCPSALVALFEAAFLEGGIVLLTVSHPQDEDERELDVEYLRVHWGTDGQYEAGDPVEGLYVEFANHGAHTE